MKKIRINVTGRVQGVGFRYMTKVIADKLQIKGAVWNEDNGSVSINACGSEEQIQKFLQQIEASPTPAGKVASMTTEEDSSMPEYTTFNVTN